jgi:hypothetical protein
MNDELNQPTHSPKNAQSLDARFATRPHVYARLQQIADMMDQAMAEGCTADQAEALAIEQLRPLGQDLLVDWAQQKQRQSLRRARQQHPQAINHIKKK